MSKSEQPMRMEAAQVQSKFKLLFDKIKEPGYVMDNYYADGLINTLLNETEEVLSSKLFTQLADLIAEALDDTDQQHISIRVFVTRLLAIVAQKEITFTKVFAKRGDLIAEGFKKVKSTNTPPSLRVAYTEVALAIISHDSGTAWVLETEVWKEILSFVYETQTIFIIRQTYKFASKLIWKLNDAGDEENIKLIYDHIFNPIKELDLITINTITVEEEERMRKRVEPSLHILLSVLAEAGRIQTPNVAITILITAYQGNYYYIMLDKFRGEHVSLLICKLLFWLQCGKVFVTKPLTPATEYQTEDFNEITATYFNTMQMLVQRRSATIILDFCNECHLIWLKITSDKALSSMPSINHFHNQLLFVCLVPLLVYLKKLNRDDECEQERLKSYITMLLNRSCEHTARAGYSLRDLISELDSAAVALQSVKRMTCLKNHLNDEQANIVFQPLFFFLTHYDEINSEEEAYDYDDGQEKVLVMTYVLDIVLCLVNNHNLRWQESMEVLCLYNLVYAILHRRQNASSKFVCLALNVISSTIKKFLPPNLSLLLETQPGTKMHDLGNIIYMKMHDLHWEVRDSALELLLVITDISFVKFPPFQNQIKENKLINTAATMAFNDLEYYVQASALKCLGAASKIGAVWEQLVSEYPDIQDRLISILLNNHEGIVRKGACNVLCDIYQNLKLTPAFKDILYEHMVSSALSDFHWEVQLSALKFWKIVIECLLSDQGMLDGTFPPVTFSRETRKIVTLNETEIQKRLIRVLDALSAMGCLTVFVKLLHEDTDVEILDTTLSIAAELINILNKYKVPEVIKPKENEISLNDLHRELKVDSSEDLEMADADILEKSDRVIEGILNADDISLLANVYQREMRLESNTEALVSTPKLTLNKLATPYLFVSHWKSTDFKAIVDYKRKWKDGIRSLSSLLDDVLGIYEINEEINTLDCY